MIGTGGATDFVAESHAIVVSRSGSVVTGRFGRTA